MKLWLFALQGILTLAPAVKTQSYTDETNLRANLSNGYNRRVRPSSPTNVTVFYNIRALQDLDITEQEITITGWVTLFWTDGRLTWDDSDNGIEQIEIDWGWRPEFVISNSASEFAALGMKNENTRLRVFNNGRVRWNPLLHSKTSCDVDISNFPFDTQTCDIEMIFWSYSVDEVFLTNLYKEVDTMVYLENAEWKFDGSETDLEYVALCCPETVGPIFRISFTFSRRRPFYVMNLISPAVLLSVCMVWAFLLPTESGERLGYSLTILLAYTVQMSITAQLMPTTSKQVPHIAMYLLIVLILCSVVTCNVVLHVKLFYKQDPVYGWMKAVFRKVNPVVFFTWCSRNQKSRADNKVKAANINRQNSDISLRKSDFPTDDTVVGGEDNDKDEVTWARVSILLDRICFYVYVVAVATVNGVFLDSIS